MEHRRLVVFVPATLILCAGSDCRADRNRWIWFASLVIGFCGTVIFVMTLLGR